MGEGLPQHDGLPQEPRVDNRDRNRLVAFIVVIVVCVAGGLVLILSAVTGGGSKHNSTGSTSGGGPTPIVSASLGPVMAGNAKPSYSHGNAGVIDVVYLGPLLTASDGGVTVPVVVRNNTSAPVSHIDITGDAQDAAGTVIATGTNQVVEPAALAVGQVGFSSIHFPAGSKVPPANAVYAFTIKSVEADTTPANTASLEVTQANASGNSITGTATNGTGRTLQGPYAVEAFCFDVNANLIDVRTANADQSGQVAAGGKVNYTVAINAATCSSFLVGVSGHYA